MITEPTHRHIGLFGATAVGVGAIVGGGILALAGVAFATTGPGAMLAFALNGGIAFLTAASFAELAARFPQSGGTYTYAKRVLSIEVAFLVGWVVWFASIVAGVLYALGFAAFAAEGVSRLLAVRRRRRRLAGALGRARRPRARRHRLLRARAGAQRRGRRQRRDRRQGARLRDPDRGRRVGVAGSAGVASCWVGSTRFSPPAPAGWSRRWGTRSSRSRAST